MEPLGRFHILEQGMSDQSMYADDRAREKHLQREDDRRALELGEKSPAELRSENGHFAFDVKIDFSNSAL